MKIRTVSLWLAVTILGIGAGSYFQSTRQNAPEEIVQVAEEPEPQPKDISKPVLDLRAALPPQPKPTPNAVITKTVPVKKAVAPNALAKAESERKRREAHYWQQHEKNFNRQLSQLNQEKNPARRNSLIQGIARYVQVDTLGAIEWAMGLQDADERQAALSAINKNALTGIGARIELDKTGLPKIRETTILSAIDSTGLVEPGDYISGLVQPDGTVVQFKGLPLQQVVQKLRGKPGTQTHLKMERMSPEGVPYYFDVPVQRSLIVVQPPL